jgi:major histocompatibility complex class I
MMVMMIMTTVEIIIVMAGVAVISIIMLFKEATQPGVVVHAFNPSTREAETGAFLSSRPAWSTK